MDKKIWFITGVSSGFGKALVEEAVAAGYFVIVTLRQDIQVDQFNASYAGEAKAYLLDVNYPENIKKTFKLVLDEYKKIDVLVNNAGYGLLGAIEEISEQETRAQMETNFFGALFVTQAVLPMMRERKMGHIFQISSMAGFCSAPGMGVHNASKYALEGFSEALALEVAPFNIKVTIIEPGPFRTAWAGSSLQRSKVQLPAYEQSAAGSIINMITSINGKQEGCPIKASKLIIKIANTDNPPLRVPFGKPALDRIKMKLKHVQAELATWEEASLNTKY